MSDARPERPNAPHPPVLFGRARHVAEISRAAESVETGAQFVLIEGESGFGKTALLREALTLLPPWPRYHAVADAYERALPYGVLNQLLAPFDQSTLPPVLANGIDPDVSTLTAGAALLSLIDGSTGPAIIVIDDAQWVDEQSARALWFAGRRSLHDRLFILVAARPASTDLLTQIRRFVVDGQRGIRVSVHGLSADNVIELVSSRLGVLIPRRTARRLVGATDGNALHLHAIVDRVASAPDAVVELERRLGDGVLPLAPGFELITRESMERLSDAARTVVELIAVFDGRATVSLVGAAAGRLASPVAADEGIDEAIESGMIETTEANGPAELRLSHQRVGDAVLAALPLRKRQDLHRAVAEVVGGDRALRHMVRSAHGPDDALAAVLDRAADDALRHRESERAVRYGLWASSLSSSPVGRHERLIRAGVTAIATQRFGLIISAIPEFSNLPAGVERDLLLGSATYAAGDIISARTSLFRAANSKPSRLRDHAIIGLANLAIVYLEIEAHRFDVVCRAAEAILCAVAAIRADPLAVREHVGPLDLDELEGTALTWLTFAQWRSGAEEFVEPRLTEQIARAQVSGFEPRHAGMLVIRGSIRRQQGRLDDAISDLERGIELTDTINPTLAPFARIELALAQFRQGRWDDAATTAAVALSLADDFGGTWTHSNCYVVAALVPAARGELGSHHLKIPEVGVTRPAVDESLTLLVEAVAARAAGDRGAVLRIARKAFATLSPRDEVEKVWWTEIRDEASRPTRRAVPPKDPFSVLSGREREVAHLAAQGLTNREVAQRLYVTVKGVEYHMGNVLAKLHLTSRRGIRTLLDGRGTSQSGESEKTLTRDAP